MGRAETGDTPPGGSKGAGDFLGVGRGGGGARGFYAARERGGNQYAYPGSFSRTVPVI